MAEVRIPTSEEFPRNSIPEGLSTSQSTSKLPTEAPPKADKVVSNKVITRKQPLSRKILKTFVGQDVVDVKGYLINEMIVPSLKNFVCDVMQDIPQMLLFGDTRRSRDPRARGGSYVSYDRFYSGGKDRRDRRDNRGEPRVRSLTRYTDEIILTTRGECEKIIFDLSDRIEDYGQATIADLNDMIGKTGEFTDCYWGWADRSAMRSASFKRVREGWLLLLPEAVSLR